MKPNHKTNPSFKSAKVERAVARLRLNQCRMMEPEVMERALIAVLQGKAVNEIGKYQVYSDYREKETVVFILNPSGCSEHKYIFAEGIDHTHTYIVAAPTEWTRSHKHILQRVAAATGERVRCPGGGYVNIRDGVVWCGWESEDYGTGDHERAKKALEKAVCKTAARQVASH